MFENTLSNALRNCSPNTLFSLLKSALLLGTSVLFTASPIAVQSVSANDFGKIEFCRSVHKVDRLIWEKFPLQSWDDCTVRYELESIGYNTPKLTLGKSAEFDDKKSSYTHEKSGNRWEPVPPGSALLFWKHRDNDNLRSFARSLTSNRDVFLKLTNSKVQLITSEEYALLRRIHGKKRFFFSLGKSGISLSTSRELKEEGRLGTGRFVVATDSDFIRGVGEIFRIDCVKGCPSPKSGWVKGEDLVELIPIKLPTKPFPTVVMHPTNVVKQCYVTSEASLSEQTILDLQASLGIENIASVGASLRKIIDSGTKTIYDDDIEIEWTVFTITEHKKATLGLLLPVTKWVRDGKPHVVVVGKFTKGCNISDTNNPKISSVSRLKILTLKHGTIPVTDFEESVDIENTRQVNRFVFNSLKALRSRIDPWVLKYIAAGLASAQ